MTKKTFKKVLTEVGVDLEQTKDIFKRMYTEWNIKNKSSDSLFITKPVNNYTEVSILWVAQNERHKGIATKYLNSITGNHSLMVDHRSEAMHELLQFLGYHSSRVNILNLASNGFDNFVCGGKDRYYFKAPDMNPSIKEWMQKDEEGTIYDIDQVLD